MLLTESGDDDNDNAATMITSMIMTKKSDNMNCSHKCNVKGIDYQNISKIQLVVYHQCCVLIGCATSRLYVIAH